MIRTLVFDLDGTLVDSVPDLLSSANRVMATRGLAPFSRADIVPMVGDGASALVKRLFQARNQVAQLTDLDDFLADYLVNAAIDTRPYPGVPATLQALLDTGWRMAVCTNKPEAAARAVLDALDLTRFFTTIAGGDTYPTRKPDPAHLLNTLKDAAATPGNAIMVGDHHNDLAAAGAQVPSIFAAWGYGEDTGATMTATRFSDIPNLVTTLLPLR